MFSESSWFSCPSLQVQSDGESSISLQGRPLFELSLARPGSSDLFQRVVFLLWKLPGGWLAFKEPTLMPRWLLFSELVSRFTFNRIQANNIEHLRSMQVGPVGWWKGTRLCGFREATRQAPIWRGSRNLEAT